MCFDDHHFSSSWLPLILNHKGRSKQRHSARGAGQVCIRRCYILQNLHLSICEVCKICKICKICKFANPLQNSNSRFRQNFEVEKANWLDEKEKVNSQKYFLSVFSDFFSQCFISSNLKVQWNPIFHTICGKSTFHLITYTTVESCFP